MPDKSYPKGLIPPSEGYPRWMGAPEADLIYLGWGERNFEQDPLPLHSNTGWVYWVVTEGEILVEFEKHMQLYRSGDGLLAGPDLPFGFPAHGKDISHILAWIWKSPPPSYAPSDRATQLDLNFSPNDVALLDQLHRQCRYENLNADNMSADALLHLRGTIDVLFARAHQQRQTLAPADAQLRMARQWMLEHLSVNRPIADLARYLNIAPITLHRLFKDQFNESPGNHFRRLKMERAQELLHKQGFTVKHVAFELGYQHANDFSRAYRSFWGAPPSTAIGSGATE